MSITYKDLVLINIFTGLNGVGKTELIQKLNDDCFNNAIYCVNYFHPENSLHPKLQIEKINRLIYSTLFDLNLIYGSNYKVMIETHSDHIINSIRVLVKKGKIHHSQVKIFNITKNDTTNVEIIELDHNGTFSSNPEGFMDEWVNQLYKLI